MLGRVCAIRILQAVPTLLGVATLVFFLLHLVPGDPVDALLGESALAADREAMRQALHLDLPLFQQYTSFLGGLFTGEWGNSIVDGRGVFGLITERLPATAKLAAFSLVLALLLALPLGYLAARHAGSARDYASMSFSLLGVSIPNFWLGPMLMLLFSVTLGWFPVSGMDAHKRKRGIGNVPQKFNHTVTAVAHTGHLESCLDDIRQ